MNALEIVAGVFLLIACLLIIVSTMLQNPKQGGLGSSFGSTESYFGKNSGRTMEAVLARLTKLGGNDGLRGFQPQQTEQTLRQILQDVKAANAEPLLMQIRLPANYGRRYNEAFSAIYPKLAKEFDVPLLPFFMEEVYLKPQWMQDDGIHPNRDAQPFIADWMAKQLQPLVNHDS